MIVVSVLITIVVLGVAFGLLWLSENFWHMRRRK